MVRLSDRDVSPSPWHRFARRINPYDRHAPDLPGFEKTLRGGRSESHAEANWLILVATCGILMLGSKAEEYYYNIFFRVKMLLLGLVFVHGWIFSQTVYYNTAEIDHTPQISGQVKAGGTPLAAFVGRHRLRRTRDRIHRSPAQ